MEDISNIKTKSVYAIIWQLCQKVSSQGMQFVISIILARLLVPEDFGVVAMTSIFMRIASIFVESGLGVSLIQKKNVDDLDYNTVLYTGLLLGAIFYSIIFFCSPYIGQLYHNEIISDIIRVLGLSLFISAFASVQNAYVTRKLDYKKFFYVSLISTFISGAVGLVMAFYGLGVWALVYSQLLGSIVGVFTMNRIVKWCPKLQFSFSRLKNLYSFGLNLMFAELMGNFFNELRGFLIGANYRPSDLAFYNRGDSLPQIFSNNISGTLNGVLFPVMSKYQNDKSRVKSILRRSITTTSFIIVPVMVTMSVTADKIIPILYSSKWSMAIPFMQIIAFKYCFNLLGGANLQAIKSIGRSDIVLKLEFIKKPLFLIMLLYTVQISPLAICIGNTLFDFLGASINAYPNKKLLNYSYVEQLKDLMPQFLLSFLMGIVIYLIGIIPINVYISFFLQIFIGFGLYIYVAFIFKIESFTYLMCTIKSMTSNFNLKLTK